jgi:hypothetical protein
VINQRWPQPGRPGDLTDVEISCGADAAARLFGKVGARPAWFGTPRCDGTDNGRPLYRERYVGREEETSEIGGDEELRRSTGDEERSGASGWDDDVA